MPHEIYLFLFLLLLLFPLTTYAAEALTGDTIKLDDGRTAHLLGIKSAGPNAITHLQSLIANQQLDLQNTRQDRYSRLDADITANTVWLQAELLKTGEAFVYPPTGTEPHLAELLQIESTARAKLLGIWNKPPYADIPATETKMPYGRFAFITGKVMKAERVKDKFYLNFGANWRDDFTITIAARHLRLFRSANIDPQSYQGKTIRVRSWINRYFGPMITVTHPSQIEILGETPAKP